MADQAHIKRERAKAREMRESQWWKNQIGPGLCHHCGQKFPKSQLTMDHLTPLARGGKTTKSNVVPSCKACNQTRGHKLDVERAMDEMASGAIGVDIEGSLEGLWLAPEHLDLLGEAQKDVNCFAVSQFYFGGLSADELRRLTADEVLDWVASEFMQIASPSDYEEPVLVIVWSRTVGGDSIGGLDGAFEPPNVRELAKRKAGFPFGWVVEHTTVLVEPVGRNWLDGRPKDQPEDQSEHQPEKQVAALESPRVYEKASPHVEDAIAIRSFSEAIHAYKAKPGFALSFHVPV